MKMSCIHSFCLKKNLIWILIEPKKKSTKKKKDITFFVVIQREDEEGYNQEYKNKRPSVDALEIKGGKS